MVDSTFPLEEMLVGYPQNFFLLKRLYLPEFKGHKDVSAGCGPLRASHFGLRRILDCHPAEHRCSLRDNSEKEGGSSHQRFRRRISRIPPPSQEHDSTTIPWNVVESVIHCYMKQEPVSNKKIGKWESHPKQPAGVEIEKTRKYGLLASEIAHMYKCKVEIIPYVMTWEGVATKYHRKHRMALGITKHVEAYIQSQVLRRTFISAVASLRPVATGIGICRRDTVRAEAERLYQRCEGNLPTQDPGTCVEELAVLTVTISKKGKREKRLPAKTINSRTTSDDAFPGPNVSQ